MKRTKKWERMGEIYKKFAVDYNFADFSEEAKDEMFLHESLGYPVSPENGYYLGKRYMDATIAMWKEDILQGTLLTQELVESGYDRDFLNNVGILWLRPALENCKWWYLR